MLTSAFFPLKACNQPMQAMQVEEAARIENGMKEGSFFLQYSPMVKRQNFVRRLKNWSCEGVKVGEPSLRGGIKSQGSMIVRTCPKDGVKRYANKYASRATPLRMFIMLRHLKSIMLSPGIGSCQCVATPQACIIVVITPPKVVEIYGSFEESTSCFTYTSLAASREAKLTS